MISTIFSNIYTAEGIATLLTFVFLLIAIFFSFRAVRTTTKKYSRSHLYIFIALLFLLFGVGAKICGFHIWNGIRMVDIANLLSSFFFVLGFTLYMKNLREIIGSGNSKNTEIGKVKSDLTRKNDYKIF